MSYAATTPIPTLGTMTDIQELMEMLQYKRPAGSMTEQRFIDRYIVPLGAQPDGFGNYWLDVGDNPTLLFSSHTDTVHHEGGHQDVNIDDEGMISAVIFADDEEEEVLNVDEAMKEFAETGKFPKPKAKRTKLTNCLGADCTTGVWLMMEMIRAGVEGRYVFHREEETGGGGSSYVAKEEPQRLEGIQAAIAFDRKGYRSIITHQMMGRCCSDEFADSLAKALDMNYETDDTGTFTDTANYTELVGECTNISVGYFAQHGPTEEQDAEFALALRDALICSDFTNLVFKREPGEDDPNDPYYGWNTSYPKRGKEKTLYDLVYSYPEATALVLEAWGVTFEELKREIDSVRTYTH